MRTRLFSILVFSLIAFTATASIQNFRAMYTADPATTVTIGFEQYNSSTFGDPGDVIFYWDTVDHGTNTGSYANSKSPDRVVDYKGMDNNFVRLTGLQPATRYYFVVKDDQETTARYFVETLPDTPDTRLSIIAGGDSRDIPVLDDDIGRQNANRMVARIRPHLVLFGGDMTLTDDVTHPLDVNEWPEWMEDWQLHIADDGRLTPIVVARGNHEYDAESVVNFFDIPNDDAYYSLFLGGNLVHTLTLNTEISRLGDQLTWLENEISNSCAVWKIAQYHRPTRPHEAEKDEQDDQANAWSPLFEEHGAQLVIESDAHLCKYTHPLRRSDEAGNVEGFVEDFENGVVYIGEGGWGAELRTVDDDKAWTLASGSFNQVKWLFIDKDKIEVRTINTDNAANVVPKIDGDDLFSMPDNINLWEPPINGTPQGIISYNGDVLTLLNPNDTDPNLDLGPDFEMIAGNTATLDAGDGFDSYQWSTGETTQTITVSDFGTYTCTVTTKGCTKEGSITVTEDMDVSTIDFEEGGYQLSLSPNPTQKDITAVVEAQSSASGSLSIMDATGRLLQSRNMDFNAGSNVASFDMTMHSKGVYFMVLEFNNYKTVRKFVFN